MIDWNDYRARYDAMSYEDVAAFHRRVWDLFPDQSHHSPSHLAAFFDARVAGRPVRVLEVGGWRGEAAAASLERHPSIVAWVNYEICEPAATSPVTDDPRYRGMWPTRWPWEVTPPGGRYDVAVLAHVIEHMKVRQLVMLVSWLAAAGVREVYVEAPLRETPRSWRRSDTAHILEVGWASVIGIFKRSGFAMSERHSYEASGHPTRHVLIFGRAVQ